MLKSPDELMKLTSSLKKAMNLGDRKECYNSNCNRKTADLVDANSVAKFYFGVPINEQSWKICQQCQLKVEKFEKESKEEIKTNGNMFSLTVEATSHPEVIELDHIVSDKVPVGSPKSETNSAIPVYSLSQNEVMDELNDMLRKFSLKEQVKKCKNTLSDEVHQLAKDFDEQDKLLEQLSDDITKLHQNYNRFVQAPTVELGTVDVSSTGQLKIKENDHVAETLKLIGFQRILPKAVKDFRSTITTEVEDFSMVMAEKKSSVQPLPRGIGGETYQKTLHLNQHNENTPPPTIKSPRKLLFQLPRQNQLVYAMYGDLLHFWLPAKVISVLPLSKDNSVITIQLQNVDAHRQSLRGNSQNLSPIIKEVFGKQIAFSKPLSKVELPVGTRVISKFYDLLGNNSDIRNMYYSGIVAESRLPSNSHRYLIFFDDGYPQYTIPEDIFPIVQPSTPVWEDVHVDVKNFIKDFLMQYPNQRLVKAKVGNRYKIEFDGKWLLAQVVQIDGSLMKLQYPAGSTMGFEWVYMGSPRLQCLYNASNIPSKSKNSNNSGLTDEIKLPKQLQPHSVSNASVKVEEKSCKKATPTPMFTDFESAGTMNKIQIPKTCPSPKVHVPHTCSPLCAYVYVEKEHRKTSPLIIPFVLGWAREFRGANLSSVSYITPCGLRLNTYEVIHAYNRMTQNNIPIEFFSLENGIDCLNEFSPVRQLVSLKDISYGKEWTPVQCVNSINHDLPDSLNYFSERKLGEGVNLNFDEEFMACCDCTDDCKDKTKCSCWQLTLSGLSFKNKSSLKGYEFRRLKNWIESGIYECNHRCKCRANTCLNRVIQSKVKWPVQVFKTISKGWGVRALYDIPKGSFLCVYTGKLLNDAGANKEGLENGDEYLADLDYIESMEAIKEGYESDCADFTDDDELENKCMKSTDKDAQTNRAEAKLQVARKSTAGRKVANVTEERVEKKDESSGTHGRPLEEKRSSLNVKRKLSKAVPYRRYFGATEKCYSIDGKGLGNFGRYFNHSCNPNLFIQNVFVDTHDLRFPWVAFFTKKDVKAGTELCWDYKYQVGSVPGKCLICYCGSKNCRGRLL